MQETLLNISIQPYAPFYKQGCINAFESNTPKFFTLAEVDQFREWLAYLEGRIDLYHGEVSHYYVALYQGSVIGCGLRR